MYKKITLLATLIALGSLASNAQAQTLEVDPSLKTVNVGDVFTLDIMGKGFINPIIGGGFNLSFDSSVLHIDSVDIPAAWEFAPQTGSIDNLTGNLSNVAFNTFVSPKSGDFTTATIHFSTVGAGNSAITLTSSATFPFADSVGNPVSVSFLSGSIAAVPEASSISMMLAGLGLIGYMARRRAI